MPLVSQCVFNYIGTQLTPAGGPNTLSGAFGTRSLNTIV
jgi:hypothetical protein